MYTDANSPSVSLICAIISFGFVQRIFRLIYGIETCACNTGSERTVSYPELKYYYPVVSV